MLSQVKSTTLLRIFKLLFLYTSPVKIRQIFKSRTFKFVLVGVLLGFIAFCSLRGKIISENLTAKDTQPFAQKFVKSCASNSRAWRDCYGKNLAQLTKDKSYKFAIATIEQIKLLDAKTNDCHILAHYSSIAGVEKNPKDWKDLVKQVNLGSCNYGFIHGIFEGLSRFDPSFRLTVENIPNLCKTISSIKKVNGSDQACAHIMGHVLLAGNCSKTIEETINKTVLTCDALPQIYKHECFAGTFMESFTRENLEVHCGYDRIPWNEENIANQERICFEQIGEASLGCWQEISHMYNNLHAGNPQEVFDACSHAKIRDNILACYAHGVNTLALKPNPDAKYFASICAPLRAGNEQQRCAKNVVFSLLGASAGFTNKAVSFCQSQNGLLKEYCFKMALQAIDRQVANKDRQIVCQKLPIQYQSLCKS